MSRARTRLRAQAIACSLFPRASLREALDLLGFVQADPIQAPARAQDLILRQRVRDYRVGDLDRAYADLDLEEDVLYAYGFVPRATWACLYPRQESRRLTKLERKVLDAVAAEAGPVHPRDLDDEFGRQRVRNAWGGHSQATKRALEVLHAHGYLRVAGRRQGVRLYEPAKPVPEASPEERLASLARIAAGIFAPARKRALRSLLGRLGKRLSDAKVGRRALDALVRAGELVEVSLDDVVYLVPADALQPDDPPEEVRILAPFDPLVHDRDRFEHLWGWAYRFEAYTPLAKRVRGYYAMPLLWRDRVVGWANVSAAQDEVEVEVGFVERRPRAAGFAAALEAEIARLEAFLRPR